MTMGSAGDRLPGVSPVLIQQIVFSGGDPATTCWHHPRTPRRSARPAATDQVRGPFRGRIAFSAS